MLAGKEKPKHVRVHQRGTRDLLPSFKWTRVQILGQINKKRMSRSRNSIGHYNSL